MSVFSCKYCSTFDQSPREFQTIVSASFCVITRNTYNNWVERGVRGLRWAVAPEKKKRNQRKKSTGVTYFVAETRLSTIDLHDFETFIQILSMFNNTTTSRQVVYCWTRVIKRFGSKEYWSILRIVAEFHWWNWKSLYENKVYILPAGSQQLDFIGGESWNKKTHKKGMLQRWLLKE